MKSENEGDTHLNGSYIQKTSCIITVRRDLKKIPPYNLPYGASPLE